MNLFRTVRAKGGYKTHVLRSLDSYTALCGFRPGQVVKGGRMMRSRHGWLLVGDKTLRELGLLKNPCRQCLGKV